MVKQTTKQGKGTTALTPKKSSWNKVDASTGKTRPTTQGAGISKNLLPHIPYLLELIVMCKNP